MITFWEKEGQETTAKEADLHPRREEKLLSLSKRNHKPIISEEKTLGNRLTLISFMISLPPSGSLKIPKTTEIYPP
jgi:hypothetical protein